jgi:glutamate dehydrogenase
MDSGALPTPLAQDLIARAAQPRWPGFNGAKGVEPAVADFLRQIGDDASHEDLSALSVDDLADLAHGLWSWEGGDQRIRIRPALGADGRPLDRDLLELAGPDMPFLVDSIMGELADQGLRVLALFHPIVARAGLPTSLIQVHLAPLAPGAEDRLREGIAATLADVRAAVADFKLLRARMSDCADELEASRTARGLASYGEALAFLRWLSEDKFIFLGARDYQYPRDERGDFVRDEPIILDETGLGILRDPDRYVLRRGSEPAMNTGAIRQFLEEPQPVLVSKSSYASRVHRRAPADYIGVKRYGADGQVVGETRFVGLFTADAYNEMTRDIPLLRAKASAIIARAGFPADSHNRRILQNIVETYPRDELFQIGDDELYATCLDILHLLDRPRPRVFVRRDRFNRFVAALAYLPKDRFNSALREAVGKRLTDAYGGFVQAFFPELGDGPLARVRYIVQDIDKTRPDPDRVALDRDIAALSRTWDDGFVDALRAHTGFDDAARTAVASRFTKAFGAGYREAFDAAEALTDVGEFLAAGEQEKVRVRAFRRAGAGADSLNCKVYSQLGALPLSAMLPMLENMGLFVITEQPYSIAAANGGDLVIHDVAMRARDGQPIDLAATESAFESAFAAIWTGLADNDGFNRLILKLGIGWRDAALIRALARYRLQSGLDPSQRIQEDALADHPEIVKLMLGLFRVRFDPALQETVAERKSWAGQLEAQLNAALDKVVSLDADRALRRIGRLIGAIQRTNFYQRDSAGALKPYLSFKIASRELEDLPEPKPYREIWVWSPQVEAVHLRFGPVARGGLRWSDRREDFRTEVLDLVKAQQVKNAIIVPVGAKGGFFPKRLPPRTDPTWFDTGKDAYRTFLRGMLDLTDNIINDKIVAPADVVRWDSDDPYIVAAADKGTATFSDTANGIAADYGFWLGDAYASGGSVGYDHKEMGITAKGAWEAVKRHFREAGKDIQSEPFTVIGVGDMSGDVFGNGMLLSRKIRLLAAFDHRDIFVDPNPDDCEVSFKERERLFHKPSSSWKDYDRALISKGGGVFSRGEKQIPLSAELRALCGLNQEHATPSELMLALLKAPCELLWFGGIGAYVKARAESHADVGDRANDAHRADAEDLQAQVIGEGANLGVTQAGRVAFARKGGRVNTDAIDNSAGVDTSDHEVNIKILLTEVLRTGALPAAERNPLLAAMTEEVGELVLADNYDQTLALTLAQASAAADIDAHERMSERLERAGKLNRRVEGLPNAEGFRALRTAGLGLTRPELAKLLAYAKIDLFDALVDSPVPDDPHFTTLLRDYFPEPLHRFTDAMSRHRLRREIIATALADDVINVGGISFVDRVRETARVSGPAIARAFQAAREIFGLKALADRINALDTKAPAALQTELHQEVANAYRRLVTYLARRRGEEPLDQVIALYRPAVMLQLDVVNEALTDLERQRAEARATSYMQRGAPEALARDVSLLAPMVTALDTADLAGRAGLAAAPAMFVYRSVGAAFGLDRLRVAAQALKLDAHWDRLALRRTVEEVYEDQRALAAAALTAIQPNPDFTATAAREAVDAWKATLGAPAAGPSATLLELESGGAWTFAKTVIAAAELRGLTSRLAA